jgi:hypothetical protein
MALSLNIPQIVILLTVAGVMLAAVIFIWVIRHQRRINAKKNAVKTNLQALNNLHDEKTPLSGKSGVAEKKYSRKISFKKHKLLKRMYNDSRKRCRGKK